jgi:hypothetical protein
MSALPNRKREKFCRLFADGVEGMKAFELAGFASPESRNHNRLLRIPAVVARIEELRRSRELAAHAARVPADQVLSELDRRGVGVADFFERNAAGIPEVRDLRRVPVEVSLAFLRLAREAFGLREG